MNQLNETLIGSGYRSRKFQVGSIQI